jgi:hypothetical protein
MAELAWIALGFVLGVVSCLAYCLCIVRSQYPNNKD